MSSTHQGKKDDLRLKYRIYNIISGYGIWNCEYFFQKKILGFPPQSIHQNLDHHFNHQISNHISSKVLLTNIVMAQWEMWIYNPISVPSDFAPSIERYPHENYAIPWERLIKFSSFMSTSQMEVIQFWMLDVNEVEIEWNVLNNLCWHKEIILDIFEWLFKMMTTILDSYHFVAM